MSDIIENIIAEARTWIKTPFQYGCTEKHKGTDCIRWLLCVVKKFGLIGEGYQPPHVNADWIYQENQDDLLFKKQILRFAYEITEAESGVGDVVGFMCGPYDRECHIGLITEDGKFIHAMPYRTVKEQRLRNYNNICAYYRLKVPTE